MTAHVDLGQFAVEQAALRRVATLIARRAQLVEVFEAGIAEVGRLVGADVTALSRYEADGAISTIGSWSKTGGTAPVDGFDTNGGRPSAAADVIVEGRLWGAVGVAATSDRPLPLDTTRYLGEFAELFAIAIANAARRAELEWLAEEQAELRKVATLVAEGAPPGTLFAVVAEAVARVVHVPLVSIVSYEVDGSATERASYSERGEVFPVGTRWPLDGTNVVAAVRQGGRPARINDYSGLEGVIAESVRRAGIHSTVGIPIVVAGRLWGAMVVSSAELEPLPDGTEARLSDFTELVATAIANAESRAELDASRARIVATADATRRRIERDLHDGAQQQLVSLALELRGAEAMLTSGPDAVGPHLSRIRQALAGVLDDLREISRGLHPAILSEGGLQAALKVLARRSPVPVELDIRVDERLPEAVEVPAYYVVSEALTNAAKYARAAVVYVVVEPRAEMLRVSVRDNGPGGADPTRGSGLLGLRDRVEAMGGTMSFQSPPGVGTALHVELPLD